MLSNWNDLPRGLDRFGRRVRTIKIESPDDIDAALETVRETVDGLNRGNVRPTVFLHVSTRPPRGEDQSEA